MISTELKCQEWSIDQLLHSANMFKIKNYRKKMNVRPFDDIRIAANQQLT